MIALNFTLPTGGISAFHKVHHIQQVYPFSQTVVDVNSYANEGAFLSGSGPMWASRVTIAGLNTVGTLVDSVEAWLISDASSPLVGGQIAADHSDTLEAKRARKVIEMSQCCADAILAGFVSSALGAAFVYPAKPNDQTNLSASVLASLLPASGPEWLTPFWCADAAGVWAFRAHTAVQIQQVGVDAKAAILNCMTINEQLRGQILAADAAELATIVWPS